MLMTSGVKTSAPKTRKSYGGRKTPTLHPLHTHGRQPDNRNSHTDTHTHNYIRTAKVIIMYVVPYIRTCVIIVTLYIHHRKKCSSYQQYYNNVT